MTRYRANVYKNEGNGIRMLWDQSEYADTLETAYAFACDLKLDYPGSEYWVAVVSNVTCPNAFM